MKIIFSFLYLLPLSILAQNPASLGSANSMGMGAYSVSVNEPEAIFSNMAAMDSDSSRHILIGTVWSQLQPGVYQISGAFINSKAPLTWGLDYQRSGNAHYFYQQIGWDLTHRKGIATIGIKPKWIQQGTYELGVFNLFEFDMGAHVELGKNWRVGLLAVNLNKSILDSVTKESIPLTLSVGISGHLSSNLMLVAELSSYEDRKNLISIGCQYIFSQNFTFRMGVNNLPGINIGIGINTSHSRFNYSLSNHPVIGNSHRWNIGYRY